MFGSFGQLPNVPFNHGGLGAPNLVSALTQGDAAGAIAALYSTIEIRTAFTPPILIDVAGLSGGQQPSGFSQLIKPAVILRGAAGPAGDLVVAPYGDPGDGSLKMVLGIGLLVGAGFLLGRMSRR